MFSVSLLRRQLWLHWQWGVWGREKGKKCAGVACQKSKSVDRFLHPCGLMTRPGVPWGFSSHKLLQVHSRTKLFLHSNVPIWRQASALWVLQSCFYALFIRNVCSVRYSVFYVCCLNLDSVVFHSDVCLASFLKRLLSMISFSRSAVSKACLQAPPLFPSFPPQTTAQLVSLADFFLLHPAPPLNAEPGPRLLPTLPVVFWNRTVKPAGV